MRCDLALMRNAGNVRDMTTLTVIDEPREESLSEAIARRLAGEFGQLRISVSEVGRRVGLSQTAMSRRMTALIPFDLAEIEHLCTVIGLDRDYILTGARRLPGGPGDGTYSPVDVSVDSDYSLSDVA